MKSSLITARKNLAQFHAYSNAAAMIEGHCKTGHTYPDELFQKAYLKQTQLLAKKLKKLADAALDRYKKSGHKIDMDNII